MNRRPLLVLAVLTLVGAALRLWGLDAAPPGLHPDEAANAYEAYCLRTTGAASDGRPWPWVFQMHGRFWVEGSYVWFVALLQGLPLSLPVSTRLPAALAGVALVPATWCLARRLLTPRVAWVAAGLLAIEPLAVHYSRVGLRASLVPAAVAWALVLLLDPRGGRRAGLWRGGLAGALAAFALWTYTPQRVWVPLLGLALLGAFWGRVKREPARWAVAGGLAVLVLLLSLPWTLGGDGRARLDAVSVFAVEGGVGAKLGAFVKGYALAFSPRALLSGSSSRGFWAEGVAPLLWVEAPLILLGVGSLVARALRRVGEAGPARARYLLLWLVLHPLPAALTVPAPNPLRGIGVLPLWALLGAEGVRTALALAQRWRGRAARRWAGCAIAVVLLVDAGASGARYFADFPRAERRGWFAGQSAALEGLLAAADAAGADVVVECAWVEAALVECAGRRWRPHTRQAARAYVTLHGRGLTHWSAQLGPEWLTARDASGREVYRRAVR